MKRKYELGAKIFKRENGIYYGWIPGRGKVSLGTRNHTEAQQEFDRLKGGQDRTRKHLFFNQVAQEYLAKGTGKLADTTKARYRWSIEKQLIPYFQFRDIRKIQAVDGANYISARELAGAAPNTILKEIFALSAVLSWCVQKGWLTVNPMREVKKPSRREVVRPNYTPNEDEINTLIKALYAPALTFFLALCNTGCRVNELRQANVGDFNYDKGELQVIRKGGKQDVVFLNDMIRNRLADDLLKRAMKRDVKPSDPLFLNRYGKRLYSIKRALQFACERAKIPHMTHHSLRHGYATILYEQGWEIPAVANCLGNSIQVCTDIYIKWKNRKQKEQAKTIQIGRLTKD